LSSLEPGIVPSSLQKEDCLICKLMHIRNEKADIIKWIFSSDKSLAEKTKLASLLTDIEFDQEILECLEDPLLRKFLFSSK
jgi:hypothetical protein